jgi:2-alkyl-3-oxoalkanoate reductase
MTVLVTGGGGFLGSRIAKKLSEAGGKVRVLGRRRYPELEEVGISCAQGDVCDPASVRSALMGVDTVFHVAARVGYWGPYADYAAVNVEGTQNLLDRCRELGVRRFVYTSTPSVVIGSDPIPVGADESLPYARRFLSSYAATKAEAERRVLAASYDGRLVTASIRPHFIFGPGDPHIAPRLVERFRQGRLMQVGDGENQVDVTYIDNAVEAHVKLAEAMESKPDKVRGQAYFIGQESPVRLWAFVERLLAVYGEGPIRRRMSRRFAHVLGGALEGSYRTLRIWRREPPLTRMAAVVLGSSHAFSHRKAEAHFGYWPRVSLDEAFLRLALDRERTT